MQCGCPQCGALMAQREKGLDSACRCPWCGHECKACLGREAGADRVLRRGMDSDEWELLLYRRGKERESEDQ